MDEAITIKWAIQQGGLALTTVIGLALWHLERRDRIKERDANAMALKAAQDQSIQVTAWVTKADGTIARMADVVQQLVHRVEALRK